MIPGFHIGGMLLHTQQDAIAMVAELGYRCVAIRPRAGDLDPRDPHFGEQVLRLGDAAARAEVQLVLDADALFMPDRNVARGPSLASLDTSEAARARQWITRWIEIAGELGCRLLTFSSGKHPVEAVAEADRWLDELAAGLDQLSRSAQNHGVGLALRPRSGDAVATVAHFERLQQWMEDSGDIALAADVAEMIKGHEIPLGDRLARNMDSLECVYLCDHRPGMGGDQRIGHGEVAVSRIVRSLREQGFQGMAVVRAEGHSEQGLVPAQEGWEIFQGIF
ncbi:MAG: sugar phosphate isomerase/epimerase [Pirellulales bacterium]|nr:sugar phosphate isomerase/epimerase [Pirellulales bacterium]